MRYRFCLACLLLFFALSRPLLGAEEAYRKLTNNEVQDIVTRLWFADESRIKPTLNFQQKVARDTSIDNSPDKLFVNDSSYDGILQKPSVKRLLAIFDLYDKIKGDRARLDEAELKSRSEEFLREIVRTNEMKILRSVLARYNYEPARNETTFMKALYDMWFERYSRKKVGKMGSSAFQHVFVGEINPRQDEVSGLHNWIRFLTLERRGDINYAGYIDKGQYISVIRYRWKGNLKTVGSMFTGTSPEFDLAVFTLCYITKPGRGRCNFVLGDCTQIRVTSMTKNNNRRSNEKTVNLDSSGDKRDMPSDDKAIDQIATVYPEKGKVLDKCDIKKPSDKVDTDNRAAQSSMTGTWILNLMCFAHMFL